MSNQIKQDTPIKELIKKGDQANCHLHALLNAKKKSMKLGLVKINRVISRINIFQ